MPSISVVTAATERWVISEAEARAMLGDTLSAYTQSQVEAWLGQITSLIEGVLNRTLPQDRIIETFVTPGYREYALTRKPIKTIHSITLNDIALTSDDWQILDEEAGTLALVAGLPITGGTGLGDYLADYTSGALGIGLYSGAMAGHKWTTVINYTAGYGMGGSILTPALPGAIKSVAYDALRMMAGSAARDPTVTAMKLGDASWSYASGGTGASGAADEVIQRAKAGTLAPYVASWL